MSQTLTLIFCCLMPFANHSFEIQGHRGTRGTLPENTIPGFVAAIEAGVDGMEMDLLMTKDGEIVIHHEFFVNPVLCCYLDGSLIEKTPLIRETRLSELKEFDCGTLNNPRALEQRHLPGTQIPTLEELLRAIHSLNHPNAQKVRLNLEVKAKPQTPEYLPPHSQLIQKIVQIVKDNDFTARVCYSSFDLNVLQAIRKFDPNAQLGIIFEADTLAHYGVDVNDWTDFITQKAKELSAAMAAPDAALLSPSKIQILHEAGLKVIPWTVNREKDCIRLLEMGVDGIITDYPEKIIHLREELGQ